MKGTSFRNLWVMSGIVLALMLALSLWAWFQIPAGAVVPIHFDINGNPDAYGNPFPGLFLLPIVSLFVVLLIGLIPRIEPRQENFQMSARAYRATWGVLLLFLAGLHTIIVLSTLQLVSMNLFGTFLPLAMGILFLVLGNWMPKVRSNFMFGIRTPWTLSSDMSWNKTHRLGGRLMMAIGALTILTSLFLPLQWVIGILVGGLLLMLLVTIIYSWMVYRDDPDAARA